jgi:magnesium chelatase subunit H
MPVEFQTLDQWGGSERGLLPVEATMMVAIPELDGATGPMVYGGRSEAAGKACTGCDKRLHLQGRAGRARHADLHRARRRAVRPRRPSWWRCAAASARSARWRW